MNNQEYSLDEKAFEIALDSLHVGELTGDLLDVALNITLKPSNDDVKILYPLIGKGIL